MNYIKEIIEPFMSQIREKNIKIEFEESPIEHYMIADWRLYKLAIYNII